MNHKDLILTKKNILTADQCKLLINEFKERKENANKEECANAITGKLTTSTFDVVSLIPNSETFKLINNKISNFTKDYINFLKEKNSVSAYAVEGTFNFAHAFRLMCYKKGGWIHPHIDWTHGIHGSCTINLNEEYEGGDFYFFNGKHKVELKTGDGLIFPANPFWIHEVKEVTKHERYSVNCFITSLPYQKIQELNTIHEAMTKLNYVKNNPHKLNYIKTND